MEKSVLRGGEHEPVDRLLAGQVESRRPARDVTVLDLQVLAAAHIVVARADQEHEVAFRAQTRAKPAAVVFDYADHPHDRGRIDGGLAVGVVVQAHVAADDWQVQGAARVRQAGDRLLELPVHLGAVRVGEVQAVGDGQRPGAGGDDVARRLGHRELGAEVRVEVAVARVAIGGHGESKSCALDAQHSGVAAGRNHGRVADHVIVAAEHAPSTGKVGACQQSKQRGKRVDIETQRRVGCHPDEAAHRSAVRQQRDRQASDLVPSVDHCQLAVVRDLADDGRRQVPRVEDGLHLALAPPLNDDQHPLLGFGKHHVVRRHLALAPWHEGDVDARTGVGHPACAFGHRGSQARGAEVLDRDHRVGV